MKKLSFLLVIFFFLNQGFSQDTFLYKEVDEHKLFVEVHKPSNMNSDNNYPALVFFFGGGWKHGDRSQFVHQAKHFAKRGLVCFLVDYRINSKHMTTPFDCVKDAKSAMRYIRSNASDFGIDSDKIIAAGGSAGGHLAAATAFVGNFNEETDDLSVSPEPQALMLFNPVIDNGPGGYGHERIGDDYEAFSPIHNIAAPAPPTIFFLGTKDPLIPVETAKKYKEEMDKVGGRCDLMLYKNQRHGFFNIKRGFKYYKKTLIAADGFLQSLGYVSGEVGKIKKPKK